MNPTDNQIQLKKSSYLFCCNKNPNNKVLTNIATMGIPNMVNHKSYFTGNFIFNYFSGNNPNLVNELITTKVSPSLSEVFTIQITNQTFQRIS